MEMKNVEIQVMRGIAILMILLHHSLSQLKQTNLVIKTTFALNHVHIVVFFVIAGILFENQKNKIMNTDAFEYISSKWNRLMIPYLFWSTLLVVGIKCLFLIPAVGNIINKLGYNAWSMKTIIWNTLTMQGYYTAHLWFIYVLFLLYIVNYFGKEYLSNWRVVIVIGVLILIIYNMYSWPLLIERFLKHFLNFTFGRLIVRYKKQQYLCNRMISAISVGLILILGTMEYFIVDSFSYTYMGNLIWGLAGTQLIFTISHFLLKNYKYLSKILQKIGDYSYAIYLIHNPYIITGVFIIAKFFKLMEFQGVLIVLAVMLSVLIPILIQKVVNKRPRLRSYMFGR